MSLGVAIQVRSTVERSGLLLRMAILQISLRCNGQICRRLVRKGVGSLETGLTCQ